MKNKHGNDGLCHVKCPISAMMLQNKRGICAVGYMQSGGWNEGKRQCVKRENRSEGKMVVCEAGNRSEGKKQCVKRENRNEGKRQCVERETGVKERGSVWSGKPE